MRILKSKSILEYFLSLFIKPAKTIERILAERPSFKRIAFFLLFIGALRGIIEGAWMLLMLGQFSQVISSPDLFRSYLLQGSYFGLANIITAYVRWAMFALIPYLLGRFLGGRGKFEEFLRLYGIILGIFLVTILPNFAHLALKLPIIEFRVSASYNPALGVGQMLTSCWLAYISYEAVRITHKLSKIESVFIGLLVPLINIGLLVFGAMVFFNFPTIIALSRRNIFIVATIAFIIVALIATPILFWSGYRIERRSKPKKV